MRIDVRCPKCKTKDQIIYRQMIDHAPAIHHSLWICGVCMCEYRIKFTFKVDVETEPLGEHLRYGKSQP